MKKLLILSVLLGLMALPMFASDVSFGGDMTTGFASNFDDMLTVTYATTTDIKATIDDYNSLVIEIDWWNTSADTPDKAAVTTDVGAWLGLPVGLTVAWGWDDPDVNEFQSVSGYANEEVFDVSTGDDFCLDFLASMSMFEIELAMTPGVAGAPPADLLVGLAAKEPIPGLNAEVFYYQGGTTVAADVFDEGWFGLDAGYSAEFGDLALDAGVAFVYPFLDTMDWAFGLGVSAGYSIATVTVGLDGNETDTLNGLTATAEVAPIDQATIYAGMSYDVANSQLVEVDLGVNAHIGAVEVYLGYLVDGDDGDAAAVGDSYKAPVGLVDANAVYLKFDVDW